MVIALCKVAAWQISSWLSALRQPAHRNAAPKCHAQSPAGFLSFGSQRMVVSWSRLLRPSPSGSQVLAVVHGLAFSNGWRRTWTSARIKCHTGSPPIVGLQVHAHQAECLHITQREFGMPRSSIQQPSKACFCSSAVSSRTSLTLRSSRHLQAPLVGSLRASRSGAAYLWR